MLMTTCIVACAMGKLGIKFLEHKPEMVVLKGINCYFIYSNWILRNLISRGRSKVCVHPPLRRILGGFSSVINFS